MSVKNVLRSALIFSIVSMSSIAFAQQQMHKRTPEERAQMQMQWMQNNLALTNDQYKQVNDIMLKYATEADNAKENRQKGAMKEIQANKDAELKGIFTGNQYQLYQAHMQQMKEKMQQRRAGMQEGN